MPFKQTLLKINLEFILIQLIGSFILIAAVRNFSRLTDINMVETFSNNKIEEAVNLLTPIEGITPGQRFSNFFLWRLLLDILAIVISFLVSWKICSKRKSGLLNAGIIAVICFTLIMTGFFDLRFVRYIYNFGYTFFGNELRLMSFINGFLLIFIASIIFIFNWKFTVRKYYNNS